MVGKTFRVSFLNLNPIFFSFLIRGFNMAVIGLLLKCLLEPNVHTHVLESILPEKSLIYQALVEIWNRVKHFLSVRNENAYHLFNSI